MDARVRQHAEVVAGWSTGVRDGDQVVIDCEPGGEPLAEELCRSVASRGGQPLVLLSSDRAARLFLEAADPGAIASTPRHLRALVAASDVYVRIEAGENTRDHADVRPRDLQRRAKALRPIRELRLRKRWCLTLHPTAALAQEAGLSTDDFADLVYDMILIDWRRFAVQLRRVATRLKGSSEVHVVAPDTDLWLPVRGRVWVPSIGTHNMPSGEVFSAPHERRVEGHVVMDIPSVVLGTEVAGLRMAFDKGRVVDWSAERGAAAVRALLGTDKGASFLGEIGIGMNRGLTRPTKNILLDEKMGGTIHLALGRAYKENRGTNESAVHQDFIKTMGPGSRIEADGDVLQRGGRFWFEKGFKKPRRA